jgi:hypothetical protein
MIGEIRPVMIKAKREPWFELYTSAVLESESEHCIELVDAAEAAIQEIFAIRSSRRAAI